MLIKLRSKVLIIACITHDLIAQSECGDSHSGDGLCTPRIPWICFCCALWTLSSSCYASAAAAATVESADQHKNNSTWCAEIFQLLICTNKLRTLDHPVHALEFILHPPMYFDHLLWPLIKLAFREQLFLQTFTSLVFFFCFLLHSLHVYVWCSLCVLEGAAVVFSSLFFWSFTWLSEISHILWTCCFAFW